MPSTFLDLPLELRQRVYFWYFKDKQICYDDLPKLPECPLKPIKHLPALLSTNTAIRLEALHPFVHAGKVRLDRDWWPTRIAYIQKLVDDYGLDFDFCKGFHNAIMRLWEGEWYTAVAGFENLRYLDIEFDKEGSMKWWCDSTRLRELRRIVKELIEFWPLNLVAINILVRANDSDQHYARLVKHELDIKLGEHGRDTVLISLSTM